ncbi:2-deoxy-D-gluconate 3-dehydrogenase [Brenneria goodwinii]|uniref:2-deoxy-D-gluconate 3-dehydrogenase n=1 Tax=Brenneria goodwinii TaxID=1109412 RepID=A0AAE8JL10_9GAMM|nr:glucose 1-dehydrogenase [Brenneria goodwinii]ATA26459.1 2-deoxy-D-gluconate 3-dehydrogenase [Brenneria goodwinii]RLM15774.1 2-deoxy-D-gluconate 3-dehydrogenase [Brenneria goodwinii]
MNLFDLTGRVAVVTGGNGGIGLGIALGLAQSGATVVIAGRQKDKNNKAVAILAKNGGNAIAIQLDISNERACEIMFETIANKLGHIDIVVNNAGITIRKPPETYTLEEWYQVIDINLTGAFLCSKLAYPHMLKSGGGKIINIGSMLSIFGMPLSVPYGASKGGIVQMGRSLATAWAKDNIQVNSILPGWIETDMAKSSRVQVKGLHEHVLDRTPAHRWGMPSDLAGAAVFLASKASDFITGTVIPVDGGYSISG